MARYAMVVCCWAMVFAGAARSVGWHDRLVLSGGGYWRGRVAVSARNARTRGVEGEVVDVVIGRGTGQVDLVGARAEAVRVCDDQGVEMLFGLRGPGGVVLRGGPIRRGSRLTIPVECVAGGSARYYVYFDNPSAGRVADHLESHVGLVNGELEDGWGPSPTGWIHDAADADHKTAWVAERPHGGKRCLKTVVADGAEPTWVATRQQGIRVVGSARYVFEAWVRGEDVKGYAGWYIHVGTRGNAQRLNRTVRGGEGTFGWTKIRLELTAPADACIANIGTVLRGSGTAWFDDVTLTCRDRTGLSVEVGQVERMDLAREAPPAEWYKGAQASDIRIPVRVANFSDKTADAAMIHVDLGRAISRIDRRAGGSAGAVIVTDGRKILAHCRVGPTVLVFEDALPARTVRTWHVYVGRGPAESGTARYARLLASRANRVRNASFEVGAASPGDWVFPAAGGKAGQVEMRSVAGGRFGKRCVRLRVGHQVTPAWRGWRQDVPVEAGRTYLYAAWIKCGDLRNGTVQAHAHFRNAAGEVCRGRQYTGIDRPIKGDTDWTLLSGLFRMPPDAATFQLHLTMLATGTVWHDGVVLAGVRSGAAGRIERRHRGRGGLAVWPVNAVVKVFQDDLPAAAPTAARISVARNEAEPLQLAVRSDTAMKGIHVAVDPPRGPGGTVLKNVSIGVVGYVPIDYPTNYYQSTAPRWHRKSPTSSPGCDGWAGMWPDPLLPKNSFDLPAETTQPIWITVSAPPGAPAGDYAGKVRLVHGGKTIHTTPFTVHVWDFVLPRRSRCKAIYDLRIGPQWRQRGKTSAQTWRQLCRFMAERRVCPDAIKPPPKLRYTDGKVVADFTEYDKSARFYFDELKLPHTYTPWSFYLFGWGHPPSAKFGRQPYPGPHPFEGADRGKLNAEFKKAYQAVLKVYWEHMKAKGWASKCMLYISDEPFFRKEHIVRQMKALCEMIHEVDPAIPIYSSTWHHVPAWEGHLNVWGLSHWGQVPVVKLAQLRAAGARVLWTTDGQMCTDTPYCAVERLLPHYCFQYDVEGYEFWGITWLTYNPYELGRHRYIHQTSEPGKSFWVRYPNGDGFLAYPGGPIGHDGPVSSIRLEQAREGVEDYEYLRLLADLIARAKSVGRDVRAAEAALKAARSLVTIPNAGGRYSTKILPDPGAVIRLKESLGRAIESLQPGADK